MTDSPEAIRADIERKRRELSQDTDALVDKVTPSKIAHRQTDKIKGAFGSVRERVMGAADDAGSSLHGAGSSVSGGVSSAAHKVGATAEGNPLAVGLMAFAGGLLVASLIPASSSEKRIAADVKEQAQPLVDEAKSVAQQVGSDLKEPVQDAASAVKDTASEAVSAVKGDAQDGIDSVKDRTQEARDNVSGS
ncbi:DUF3618 domain-containing protein [Microbacterium oleivorans]|uniref:DUF3618 domain-containing protein n=1 Tax=Microbacterium oleivorans TaxID=273677 RepID=A0A7D5IQY6_9MICO|nr:DUF3618 domain-containing protein [Microbacterium oleivorans]QLD12121.1 DUF3618 domain-containing protein [Microbacterium oleivorans]